MACHQSLLSIVWSVTLVCILAVMERTVVEAAAVDTATVAGRTLADSGKPTNSNFDEVKQLEDLKQSLGSPFSLLAVHSELKSTESGGNKVTHVAHGAEAVDHDRLIGRYSEEVDKVQDSGIGATAATHVHAEIEIPAAGVHRVIEEGTGQGQREIADNVMERRSPPDIYNHLDSKYSSFSGVQYSPRDMAEYVFWTGDEKGVTLAIEEFLDDGLMTREEAITFLQEIKVNLDYLQLHYSKQQRFLKLQREPELGPSKDKAMMIQKTLNSQRQMADSAYMAKKSVVNVLVAPTPMQEESGTSSGYSQQNLGLSEEDYEELLERLKVADFLYTEYSLEEVIYQLAKVMFSQSLAKGSTDAQEALQKFTIFLASEADKGHISRGLEKKVLDVLIASLADTLAEHPRLSPTIEEGININADTSTPSPNKLLHQLLMLNPAAGHANGILDSSNGNKVDQSTHRSAGAKGRETRDSGNKETVEQVRKEKM